MSKPYKTIPSKNGSFPKGIRKRKFGSGIEGIFLKIPASTTINPTTKVRKLMRELLGFNECIIILLD